MKPELNPKNHVKKGAWELMFSSLQLFHTPVWSCSISGGLGCPGTLDGTRFPSQGQGEK